MRMLDDDGGDDDDEYDDKIADRPAGLGQLPAQRAHPLGAAGHRGFLLQLIAPSFGFAAPRPPPP